MKAKVHGVYYSYSSLMCERKPDEKLRDGMAGRRKELACVLLLKFQMNTSVIILSSYRIGIKTLLPKISNPQQFTIPMITAAIILLMNLM